MGTEDAGYVGNLDPPLLQSFYKHLLNTACMPGIVLGNTAADPPKKKSTTSLPLVELTFQLGRWTVNRRNM